MKCSEGAILSHNGMTTKYVIYTTYRETVTHEINGLLVRTKNKRARTCNPGHEKREFAELRKPKNALTLEKIFVAIYNNLVHHVYPPKSKN